MSGYIGTQPVPQATQTRDSFTATSGQTSFATGGYTPNFLDVYLNGVKLAAADYTATNGSDVVLATGAATGDILEVVAYTTFTVGSSFTPSIDDNGNATAITIDSNENVGIGTSSPSRQLEIYDDGTVGQAVLALTAQNTDPSRIMFADPDDVNIGILDYHHSDNSMRFIVNNAERMRLDSSGKVGIGTTSPENTLHILDTSATSQMLVQGNTNDASIKFNKSGQSFVVGIDATDNSFRIADNSTLGTNDRLVIDSSGHVLVGGHTSTHSPVENGGSGVSLLSNGQILAGGEYPSYFNRENSDGDIIVLRKDGSAVGSIGTNGSTLYIGSTEGADAHLGFGNQIIRPVTSSGASRDNAIDLGYNGMRFRDAYLSGGVYLGGTGSANKLSDYEEGTWTPTVGTGTMTSNFAHYTKVGNQVTISCVVYSFSDRSSTNGVGIQNLPFTSSSTARSTGSVMIRNSDNTTITAAYITSSSNTVEFYGVTTGFWDQLKHNDLNSTDSELYFNITYRTDA